MGDRGRLRREACRAVLLSTVCVMQERLCAKPARQHWSSWSNAILPSDTGMRRKWLAPELILLSGRCADLHFERDVAAAIDDMNAVESKRPGPDEFSKRSQLRGTCSACLRPEALSTQPGLADDLDRPGAAATWNDEVPIRDIPARQQGVAERVSEFDELAFAENAIGHSSSTE